MLFIAGLLIGIIIGLFTRAWMIKRKRHGHFRLVDIPVLDKRYNKLPVKDKA